MYCDILFITDLPRYVIPAGIRILEAHRYNNSPHYDWLPVPPNLASFNPLSLPTGTSTSSSQQSWSLLTHQSSLASGHRPDPDGINPLPSHHPHHRLPVQAIFMGGIATRVVLAVYPC